MTWRSLAPKGPKRHPIRKSILVKGAFHYTCAVTSPFPLEPSLEGGHGIWGVGEVVGGLVRVVFRRPTYLLHQVVHRAIQFLLV